MNPSDTFYALLVLLVVIMVGLGIIFARMETRFTRLEEKVEESNKTNEKQSVRITRVESRVKAVVKHLGIEDPAAGMNPPTGEIPIVKPA